MNDSLRCVCDTDMCEAPVPEKTLIDLQNEGTVMAVEALRMAEIITGTMLGIGAKQGECPQVSSFRENLKKQNLILEMVNRELARMIDLFGCGTLEGRR